MRTPHVYNNVMPDPIEYREQALLGEYKTYTFPEATFHGIHLLPVSNPLSVMITQKFPKAEPTLSFIRKSPLNQIEPHFIHTDVDMGDWSVLLYLNPNPPDGDGTCFWQYKDGSIEDYVPHHRSKEGTDVMHWSNWLTVNAFFNRALVFPSTFFHSRAIFNNWGEGDDARLVQVVFGKGDIFS